MRVKYEFDEVFIINEYVSGKSVMDIARYYGCSQTPIRKILFENNIPPHDVSAFQRNLSGHTLNSNVFDILAENSLYWLGFIAADGNVNKSNNNIKIKLAIKDLDHLYKFKTFMCGSQDIVFPSESGHKQCQYTFASSIVKKRLIDFGITPAKSKTISVTKELADSPHFWRGVVDGDGYVAVKTKSNGREYLAFTLVSASISFIQQFIDFVSGALSIDLRLRRQDFSKYNEKSGVLYSVTSTHSKAVRIAELLYGNCNVRLERKYNVVNPYISTDDLTNVKSVL